MLNLCLLYLLSLKLVHAKASELTVVKASGAVKELFPPFPTYWRWHQTGQSLARLCASQWFSNLVGLSGLSLAAFSSLPQHLSVCNALHSWRCSFELCSNAVGPKATEADTVRPLTKPGGSKKWVRWSSKRQDYSNHNFDITCWLGFWSEMPDIEGQTANILQAPAP